MIVYVNRKPVEGPWGGGNNFVKALFEHGKKFEIDFTYDITRNFNAILVIDPRYDELGVSINEISKFKLKNPSCQTFYRVNECDARKGTNEIDNIILSMNQSIDNYIFVSDWIKKYFEEKSLNVSKSHTIYNGVDTNHFNLKANFRQNNNKLSIVTHHWSNNALKGFDIYEKLDRYSLTENFSFTYIGRERGTFKNTNIVSPVAGKQLGELLSNHDLYVSASRFDPGPNHVIEAIASNLPILVHKDGGGSVEFAGDNCVYNDFDDLINKIKYKNYCKSNTKFSNWESCIEKYCAYLKTKYNENR